MERFAIVLKTIAVVALVALGLGFWTLQPPSLGPAPVLARVRTSGPQLDVALNGTPIRLGVIAATTTKNNHDTSTPFSNTGEGLSGKLLMIQCDAAANVNFAGTDNTITASATVTNAAYGIKLAADQIGYVGMGHGYGWVAVVGNANCTLWEMK